MFQKYTRQVHFPPSPVLAQPTLLLLGLRCTYQEHLIFTEQSYEPEASSETSLGIAAHARLCICRQTDVTLKSLTFFFSHISFRERQNVLSGAKSLRLFTYGRDIAYCASFSLAFPPCTSIGQGSRMQIYRPTERE